MRRPALEWCRTALRPVDAKQIRHIKALLCELSTRVSELAGDYEVSKTTIYKHCGVVPPRND